MTKTDADYEAEYEQDRVLRVKDMEARIAANEAITASNQASARSNEEIILLNRESHKQRTAEIARLALQTKTEIERQITECQAWLAGYEVQRPIVERTKSTLINFMTNDPNAQMKRLLALSNIEEWMAREREHAKVYQNRLVVLNSRLETL